MNPGAEGFHIICERDVGLFSLIQQVIANVPWAVKENRIPVVYFGENTCYWTPNGYRGRRTVWEYYFEPLVPGHPVASLPDPIRKVVEADRPSADEIGHVIDGASFVSQANQNPTLTILALTMRACEYLADERKRGNL